jgi:hypothetical protein
MMISMLEIEVVVGRNTLRYSALRAVVAMTIDYGVTTFTGARSMISIRVPHGSVM